VIDVTNRSDVDVRLVPLELFLRHDAFPSLVEVEPMTGLEPVTSSLPRTCSAS
jgi:hypothetical protein